MTLRKDGRRLIQLTMRPELYHRIKDHCAAIDAPISTWARSLIIQELDRHPDQPPDPGC